MATKIVNSAEEIEQDVLNRIKKALEEAAGEVAFEIESMYEKAIDKFYEFPTKGTYDRGYNLYAASSTQGNAYSSGYTMTKYGFEAGITVDPVYMGEPYKDPADYVFTGAYVNGIHGTTNTGGVGVSPKSLMDEWFDNFKKNDLPYIVDKYLDL